MLFKHFVNFIDVWLQRVLYFGTKLDNGQNKDKQKQILGTVEQNGNCRFSHTVQKFYCKNCGDQHKQNQQDFFNVIRQHKGIYERIIVLMDSFEPVRNAAPRFYVRSQIVDDEIYNVFHAEKRSRQL